MANIMKKWLPLLFSLSMIVLLLAAAPAAFAQTVEMEKTIQICDNYGGGFDKCTKHYIDYNMDLYSWGYNEYGQVGNGTKEYQATPCKILSNVVSVKGGSRVSGALTTDGDLYMWGDYYGSLVPKKALQNVKVFKILSGAVVFAITDNGDLYHIGDNDGWWGMDGIDEYSNPNYDFSVPQKILTGVKSFKGDMWSAFAICSSGEYFWGVYEYGNSNLGLPANVPTKISDNGYKTEVILKPTKMAPPSRYYDAYRRSVIELDIQHGREIPNDDEGSGGIHYGGMPEGITFTKSGNLSYKYKLIMTNVHSFHGDVDGIGMYFFTKSGELYYGSIEDDYCVKLAEGIAMPYQKLEVGKKPGSGAETKIYLQVLDSKPTGSLENFKKVNSYPAGKFTDVAADAWYAQNVKEAYELDLVKGISDASFNPSGNITVAEAVTLAARLHSIYCTGKAEFVQGMPWYEAYFEYAYSNGIIDRYNFTLDYNEVITRRDFARIFASAFPEGEGALEQINDIPDGSIPDVSSSQEFVYLLYRAGVLTGNDEQGTFAPNSSIKRSEVAAIVTRMAEPELRKHFALK